MWLTVKTCPVQKLILSLTIFALQCDLQQLQFSIQPQELVQLLQQLETAGLVASGTGAPPQAMQQTGMGQQGVTQQPPLFPSAGGTSFP
jgi:hypothetical protein